MAIVFLHDIAGPYIPLKQKSLLNIRHAVKGLDTYADNLLVRRPSHEKVLFVFVRVKFDTVGNLAAGKAGYYVASFRVPQFDVTIVC